MFVFGDMFEFGDFEEMFYKECGVVISFEKIDCVFMYGKLGVFIVEGVLKYFEKECVSYYIEKKDFF